MLPKKALTSSSSLCVKAIRYTTNQDDTDVDEMKRDIANLREEAMRRLDALNVQFHDIENDLLSKKREEERQKFEKFVDAAKEDEPQVIVSPKDAFSNNPFAETEEEILLEQRIIRESEQATSAAPKSTVQLLDNSRWRLMLNIGRETGTWMPKTWGVSGERLLMNLEMEFTPQQLYDREEFLNGLGGAKILHVIHNEATVAPTIQEGGKRIRVRDGGWKVATGEGPMGTSILRFYVDLEEETGHKGSDVTCPAGRIYCTCGYFSMEERNRKGLEGSGMKDLLREQIRDLETQFDSLQAENEMDENLFSWEKVRRAKQMMDMRLEACRLNQQMHDAYVVEPDKALLRLSRDQSVGLTREGGVCRRQKKGMAIEYHILGKFEVAAMENREHSDYRALLP